MVQDGYTRVESPVEIEALLEALSEPGGASLQLGEGSEPLPVLLAEQRAGEELSLDISAIREVAGELQRGKSFRLLGQAQGKMVRTPELAMQECRQQDGRLVCRCPYPYHLEVLQRRETFRARLRLGMEVGAILRDGEGKRVQGDLKDLSLEGCRLELPLSASSLLAESPLPLDIELCFPDGTRCSLRGKARHRRVDTERQAVMAGFRFSGNGPDQERKLWYLVREIEQEAARHVEGGEASRLPSLLFQGAAASGPEVGRRSMKAYATPMARRLSRIAGYLDAQMLELRDGNEVDGVQLSRHADRLLLLHEEDHEALLFASHCLHDESWLVGHGLGMAVHLLDLVGRVSVPHELRKALVACAMVHDLGKSLLPDDVWQRASPEEAWPAELPEHVARLEKRMEGCQWLSSAVFGSVVRRVNERLDGSGYPAGLDGEALGELERAAAVVDVVDTLRRPLGGRPAWPVGAIYRYLLDHDQAFDQRWVKRYIRRFGLFPVGSLVRFAGGRLAWVQGVDDQGRPARVQLTESIDPPGEALGEVLLGEVVQRLGEPLEEVRVGPKVESETADSQK
ncbi:PilZ domain-containing protein [Halomonas organivorans]|uniref:C-di-GMP-binding flagellar brake protein YcgR n=1 Tax=Halomonas organivorans TaxID=257772 RepID=A0A7W5G4R7_9GAMM|nr:HD domain-containing phosphohydrolase [Halomonas organivorans]MBB3140389.1 c-di-GMP-binding flagellar brake protein YcgR [Halomonas organivorans]